MSNLLNIYPTPPQVEHKALADCRRDNIRSALPRARFRSRIKPLINGYVYAEAKPQDTPYMRAKAIGSVRRADLAKLWTHCRIRPPSRPENPYKAGDEIVVSAYSYTDTSGNKIEVRGKVEQVRGRQCIILFWMAGKEQRQAMHYMQLRPG